MSRVTNWNQTQIFDGWVKVKERVVRLKILESQSTGFTQNFQRSTATFFNSSVNIAGDDPTIRSLTILTPQFVELSQIENWDLAYL